MKKSEECAQGIAYHLKEIANILLHPQKKCPIIEEDPFFILYPDLLFRELGDDLMQRLNTPDDKETFDLVEFNRRKLLYLFCGHWKPEVKTNIPDIMIIKTPANDYELLFENGAGVAVSVGFPIKQHYDKFFIRSANDYIDLDYYVSVDQIMLNNTFFVRKEIIATDNRI